MKLSEIYKIADTIAPKALSDEMCQNYGWYDNSGILVNTDEDINGILFSLDLTMAAVDEAIEKVVEWSKVWLAGGDIRACMDKQIAEFFNV